MKLPKDFGRIKMEEEIMFGFRPATREEIEANDTLDRWSIHEEDMLRQDADDKMHPASILAICAGFVAMIAVVLYLGVIVDAFIGLMEI